MAPEREARPPASLGEVSVCLIWFLLLQRGRGLEMWFGGGGLPADDVASRIA